MKAELIILRTLSVFRTIPLLVLQTLWPIAVAAAPIEDAAVEDSLRSLWRTQALAYENGEGVERDAALAATLYCRAARLGDAASQFNLGWMYANGRGVERSDSTAAFFFNAAAEQGWEQAVRMLATVGGPPNFVPDCMRDPDPPKPLPVAATAPRTPPPLVVPPRAPPHIVALVKEMAPIYRVDPQLVLSIMEAESNFDPVAVSPKNAKGLMQMVPETMERFGVRSPYDARQNIRGGMAYLRWLLAYFEGDVALVAAAYNAGEGTVNRYGGVPPYAETRAYVRRILSRVGVAIHPFDPAVAEPSPLAKLLHSASR
jgi:soluble lytic murein transglycosylase-like protein